jgi:Skp family chaperone for outer membrane proteins
MNRHLSLVAGACLVLIAFIPAAAQTRPAPTPTPKPAAPPTPPAAVNVPATKIGMVNTEVFRDEKAGIARYLRAVKSLDAEFQVRNTELRGLQTRLKTIADEITKLNGQPVVAPESIRAKQDEGERVQRELKYKKEQADADFQKRYNEMVSPITRDIGNALSDYANQQGLTMILDISKLESALLALNPATDVTLAFVADFNRKNP